VKPIDRDQFWKKKIKIVAASRGRNKSVSMRVHWFASLARHSVESGTEGDLVSSGLELLAHFKEALDDPAKADFFEELAHWLKRQGRTLTERQRRLRDWLFEDGSERQTRIPTLDQICDEFESYRFDYRRISDDLKAIGADFKRKR